LDSGDEPSDSVDQKKLVNIDLIALNQWEGKPMAYRADIVTAVPVGCDAKQLLELLHQQMPKTTSETIRLGSGLSVTLTFVSQSQPRAPV